MRAKLIGRARSRRVRFRRARALIDSSHRTDLGPLEHTLDDDEDVERTSSRDILVALSFIAHLINSFRCVQRGRVCTRKVSARCALISFSADILRASAASKSDEYANDVARADIYI